MLKNIYSVSSENPQLMKVVGTKSNDPSSLARTKMTEGGA